MTAIHKKTRDTARVRAKRFRMIALIVLFLLTAALCAGWLYVRSLAYRVCTAEAGTQVEASDFIKDGDPLACFTEGSQPFDVTVPGEYKVKVKSGWFTHRARLVIQDTVPPTGKGATAKLLPGETCSPEDLACDIEDVTQVTVSFQTQPDFTRFGSQSVPVVITDLGGNSSIVLGEIFISKVSYSLSMEAGSELPAVENFMLVDGSAEYITDTSALDLNTVADYDISISVDGEEYDSVLQVVDTVAPVASTQDISGYMLVPRQASDFVASVEDATAVTAAFVTEPDLTLAGEQELEIELTDEGGNSIVLPAKLTLEEDTEAPVIEGVRDLTLLVGESISYRKSLRVTDNCPEGLEINIDSSGVNMNQEGTYQAVYTATDLAGNSASTVITVTVLPWEHSEDELNGMADSVLASIINDSMDPMEKLTAIYNYITTNVMYVDHSEKGNWSEAAYEGLSWHKGDCYVFASTSKLLLTRAGIENIDISKSPEYSQHSSHFWNLVNIGDGWYHFDCTPRVDHPRIFMWTDEQMKNYSDQHNHSHEFDHSLYPEIN